ncbi:carbohydrate ABC transporter permease [Paenibacillus sp. NFR01]|uniref:carbohydrate ABC transporter permease n=1 Tax=Paenibacillus sp. NFR01 TaxID=1566279 RepID=UPI0008AD13AD|nr:sugar ABC transporter permease [Paenibacillus sp. NFR01]SEU27683.1 multiple sugar transport system permease protein [Paenibacillus sp. NFR01]
MGLHTETENRLKSAPGAKARWGKRIKEHKFAYLLMLPTLIFMMMVHLLPMIQGIWMSFLKLNQFTLAKYLKAPFVGISNYKGLLFDNDNPVRQGLNFAVRNTAIYAVVVTIGVMVMGLLMAILMNRDFPGRGIARTAMLLPWVIPSYVVGVLWGFMWQQNGVINYLLVDVLHLMHDKPFWLMGPNTIWAIIIPTIWRGWPFLMVIFLAGLQTIPDDIYEAATIDGAHKLRQFWHITLPMLKPIIAVQLLFQIINNVYSYNIVSTMFGNGAGYPGEWGDLLMTALTRQSFGYWAFGSGSAASLMLMIAMLMIVGVWYRTFRTELNAQ